MGCSSSETKEERRRKLNMTNDEDLQSEGKQGDTLIQQTDDKLYRLTILTGNDFGNPKEDALSLLVQSK